MSEQERPDNNYVSDPAKTGTIAQRMTAFVQHFQVAQQAVAGRTLQVITTYDEGQFCCK
jgi:hypothetical protein